MSHSELDRLTFSEAREWRSWRATIAANVRHGNTQAVQDRRDLLPHIKSLGRLRAVTRYHPGAFELGTEHADWFYETADQWGSILAPGAFQEPSHASR